MSANETPEVVHLELHTHDLETASAFYRELLRWRTEPVDSPWGRYQALALGSGLGGGIVSCGARRGTWLPYVGVQDVVATTERATRLGAAVLLEPREGPAGWRSVVATTEAGEIALWQYKQHRAGATR